MPNETKILFSNVFKFRKPLNENVNNSSIVDAINDNKYIYIYYDGDETILKGYRTIRPYVLGTSTAGNLVLRAWQEAGNSDSYAGLTDRKRQDHEYHFDDKGRMRPGWRLFRVDGIKSFLPTGKKFNIEKTPKNYNPNDKQMTSIIASIPINKIGTQTSGLDSIDEPDVIKNQLEKPKSAFDGQKEKFQYFSKLGKKTRDVTKDEIINLWDVAKTIKKKSPSKMIVVTDEFGDMILRDESIIDKLPKESIVGNLKDLYNKYVVPTQPKPNDTFFNNQKNKLFNNKPLFK
jgi:hypothetical protein